MTLFSKFEYQFRFEHSENICIPIVQTPEELINGVISINQQLQEANESGWLQITKIKQKKKVEEVLYQQKLVLPMAVENEFFDELLANFYTKKPVPFPSEHTLPMASNQNKDIQVNETTEIPGWLQSLTKHSATNLASRDASEQQVNSVTQSDKTLERKSSDEKIVENKEAQQVTVEENTPSNQVDSKQETFDISELKEQFRNQLDTLFMNFENKLNQAVDVHSKENKEKRKEQAIHQLEEEKRVSLEAEKKRHTECLEEIEQQFLQKIASL